jgi:hypothetical protein
LFLNSDLLYGKEPLMNLPDIKNLKTVKEWDGKDSEKQKETIDDL